MSGKKKKRKADYDTIEGLLTGSADLTVRGARGLYNIIKKRQAKKHLPEEVNKLVDAIEKFKPSRNYRNELPYQMELVGWLKGTYGFADIETQRGRSRPDIVTGDIAIEVKGPTTNRELKTIADKIIRYSQYFSKIIIVLFDVQDEIRYKEWLNGTEKHHPNVVVIRK
jgi:hypothetical protein